MNSVKILLIFLILVFSGCSGFQEAGEIMRNEKVKNTDEFLIKKRDALTQPPDFNKVPEPDSLNKPKKEKSEGIKDILKVKDTNNKQKKVFSSTEKSILNQIRK